MTVSASQAVGNVSQGSSYVPQKQTDPVAVSAPEEIVKVAEVTSAEKNQKSENQNNKEQDGEAASREAIKKAVSDINKRAVGTEAVFGIHEKTNRVTIKIVDKESKEVIKELPAEKTLDLIAKAWEMAGLMVDEKR